MQNYDFETWSVTIRND